jgi:DNA modification methylase
VTDPPYGLEFMGKEWDSFRDNGLWAKRDKSQDLTGKSSSPFLAAAVNKYVAGVPFQEWCTAWASAALSALKPGGYMLCFGGTRTYHRMACAIEDAGFEIRDCLMWMYGQGFPKAKSCLKPAWEPIILARKPGGKVLPLNIDACRIEGGKRDPAFRSTLGPTERSGTWSDESCGLSERRNGDGLGRWPANVVHDGSGEVMEAFAAFGERTAGGDVSGNEPSAVTNGIYGDYAGRVPYQKMRDTGTAARFFYCAKASKADRDEGLEGMPAYRCGGMTATADGSMLTGSGNERTTTRANTHPTVKPTSLMEWLIKLVARPGEVVLDPFAGSGSTLKACARIGRHGIGIEKHRPYWEIAANRIESALHAEPLLEGCA